MNRVVKCAVPALIAAASSVASAGLVFTDTFTSGNAAPSAPYPVVQFLTGPGTPPMPDTPAVVNNQLSITTQDNGTNSSYFPTAAGAPLPGGPLSGANSFSGVVNYDWQTTDSVDGTSPAVDTSNLGNEYEFFGFKGTNVNQGRQIMGAFVSHDYIGGDYIVYIEPCFASEGNTDTAEMRYPVYTLNMGTSLPANMQLALGWDAPTQTVHMQFLVDGSVVEDESSAIQNMFGPHPPSYDNATNIALEESELSVSYLGWEDYTGNANDLETHWQVNSLSYYNDSTGAFVAVPEPASIGLVAGASLFLASRRSRRQR
jgi:hypothetical protein